MCHLFEECRSIEEEESSDDDDDDDDAYENSDNGSSVLALSEIESQEESTAAVPSSPHQSSPAPGSGSIPSVAGTTTSSSTPMTAARSSSAASTQRSPSFSNRLFQRTFGRLPRSSSRRSGSRWASGQFRDTQCFTFFYWGWEKAQVLKIKLSLYCISLNWQQRLKRKKGMKNSNLPFAHVSMLVRFLVTLLFQLQKSRLYCMYRIGHVNYDTDQAIQNKRKK